MERVRIWLEPRQEGDKLAARDGRLGDECKGLNHADTSEPGGGERGFTGRREDGKVLLISNSIHSQNQNPSRLPVLDARRRIEPEPEHVPGYVNENGHGHANGNEYEHVNEKNLLVCVLVYGLGLDPPVRENSRKLGLAP